MNAVEIEEAVSMLAELPFEAETFPFAFLEAFGNKPTTLNKLQSTSGSSNQSDLSGGVLQRNNIHLKVCVEGKVTTTLSALRDSPATARYKAKFILATDGKSFEAENLIDGETIACNYPDFHDHFGFFLALAGITTVKQIRENAFDIKATGRLNRLYIELLKDNPDWDKAERREELNHFMARLIFCFFAEDTNIFHSDGLFTATIGQMSASDSANTHEVISELFRSMSTPPKERESIRNWADRFPYVNGGLFSGGVEVPRFSKIARSYLLHVGNLDWKKINPDIFGSMIQAVADDEERGALGMHYTSVPNILKVLNPLFLDDLRGQLEAAGENARKLLNLRQRMARIRVFDPACGSGNFLVIAYKEMRVIEAEINRRRGEPNRRSEIPLTNFRGIELRHFSVEIARLALVIAEYQCNVLYFGQQEARLLFLPLERDNWITCGNALRLDWLNLCPPTGTGVKVRGEDLFSLLHDEAEIDFENEGGETYICGNPPYYGSRKQTNEQKSDLAQICGKRIQKWKSLDYVAGWFLKGLEFIENQPATFAFVCTSSNCEGLQVPVLWKFILSGNTQIVFAYRPFKWANLAANNAGVIVNIVGVSTISNRQEKKIFDGDQLRVVSNISPYILATPDVFVETEPKPISALTPMITGSMPRDGGHLLLSQNDAREISSSHPEIQNLIRPYIGTDELVNGKQRKCFWIEDSEIKIAMSVPDISSRLQRVSEMRAASTLDSTKEFADRPHRFVYLAGQAENHIIGVGGASSENREYLPVALFDYRSVLSNLALAIYDAPLWNMALIASRIHLVWIGTVCGKLKTDFRYSNTLGWNTFPVPILTDQNKTDLTRCAEDILLARESYFPDTIADLYAPDKMPKDLRAAHDRNDEVLDRIYIGRRFKNDTERLEKLFELYTKMTSQAKC
jgi:hypothetical protein